MTEEKETCYFLTPGKINSCSMLNTDCTGTRSRTLCKFRKSEKEFVEARNKAVAINQRKGNCENCKYRKTKCKSSEEGEDDDS